MFVPLQQSGADWSQAQLVDAKWTATGTEGSVNCESMGTTHGLVPLLGKGEGQYWGEFRERASAQPVLCTAYPDGHALEYEQPSLEMDLDQEPAIICSCEE